MYIIIDWMSFSFVVEPEDGSVISWDSREEAEKYGEDEMQVGLYEIIKVPAFAQAFKP
jgi:hypothetical protein